MPISIAQQKQMSDTAGYGPFAQNIYNTTGNALIAFVGVGSDNASGHLPRVAVGDDAHSWWIYAGTSTSISPGSNRRTDIWIAPNARLGDLAFGTNFSAGFSQLYTGAVVSLVEVSGFPQFAQIDFVAIGGGTGFGTSTTVSGTASVADYVFGACLVSGSGTIGFAIASGSWTGLTAVSSQSTATDMASQTIQPAYTTAAAGPVSTTFSWTGNQAYVAVAVGFKQVSTPPAQPNINWPSMKVEAAFGWKPGDLAGSMPTWTDITTRAQDKAGVTVMSTARGRDYELAQPDAGQSTITLDNHDSALNPVNASGPYYPNVVPEVPVRASAVWNGRQYGLGFLYANKWPQTFPDPQYGTSAFQGSDAISIISQGLMPSAVGGQVLADFPYAYYPLNEFYQTPHGTLFANLSRTNLKPMVGYQPAGSPQLGTGLQLTMAGDSGTGIGVSGLTSTLVNARSGCGTILRDPGLPNIGTSLSISLEFRFQSSLGSVAAGLPVQLLALSSLPTNYLTGSPITGFVPEGLRFVVSYTTGIVAGTSVLAWSLVGPNGVAFGSSPNSGGFITLTEGTFYDVVITISFNGTQYVVTTYLNGVSLGTTNVAAVSPLEITGMMAGNASPVTGFNSTQNFTIGQLAYYPFVMPTPRITAHHNTIVTGDKNDSVLARFGKLAVWSGLGIPALGVNSTAGPLMGPADQIQGQPLADAIYSMAVAEGGFFYAPADATGGIWYASRTSLFNRGAKFTFGDRPDIAVTPPWGITPWSFTTSGTPANGTYFTLTTAQAASVGTGDQITIAGFGTNSVSSVGPPAFGFNNIFLSQPVGSAIPAGTTVTQFFGEIPVDYGSGFDFGDTYIFNIVDAQRITSASTSLFLSPNAAGQFAATKTSSVGVKAEVADQTSETQYMPRGPMSVNVETMSDQDAYDRANWFLAKYKQPALRASQITFSPSKNGAWLAALAVEQGDIVTVNRRPAGGTMISVNCVVQKVEHHIGPDVWDVILALAPYVTENAVLQLDNASFDQLGQGALGW